MNELINDEAVYRTAPATLGLLIIPNVDLKKGKNSNFFGEITIKESPPIYIYVSNIKAKYEFLVLYLKIYIYI